jgi:ABC-type amino acid transport substrate-binding protein
MLPNEKDKVRRPSAKGLFLSFRFGTLPVAILALMLLALYASANWLPKPPPKPDSTWTRILDQRTFRVGIDPSFPPFESDDGKGNLSGLDIALVSEISRDWSHENGVDIQVEYVYNGYDGLYDALIAGQFDAILSALPYDPKKTQDVSFTHSYFNGGPFIVVRDDDTTTKSWYDLAHQGVGVELGSSGDSFARRWEKRLSYDLHEFNTPPDALQALRAGNLKAVFTDEIAFDAFAKSEGGIKLVGAPLANELTVMAVRRDTPTLLQQINAVIDAMKRDGRMEQLYAEWF